MTAASAIPRARGADPQPDHPEGANRSAPETELNKSPARSKLVRWCKFNFVGGIGIGVQFSVLFLLKTVLHFDYLLATAIAVEVAVVHNFVWHEQFTWADRVRELPRRGSEAKTRGRVRTSFAGLTRAATQKLHSPGCARFLRFHLANGAVSILGNLALMKVMVGQGHMNYLAANGIAIALCSVANFLVSEEWVFQSELR
jgi:putative flippase GtrA